MQFDILTLFPEIFSGYVSQSLLNKAIENGLVQIDLHDIRDWTSDKHQRVDDRPYGGGLGRRFFTPLFHHLPFIFLGFQGLPEDRQRLPERSRARDPLAVSFISRGELA